MGVLFFNGFSSLTHLYYLKCTLVEIKKGRDVVNVLKLFVSFLTTELVEVRTG